MGNVAGSGDVQGRCQREMEKEKRGKKRVDEMVGSRCRRGGGVDEQGVEHFADRKARPDIASECGRRQGQAVANAQASNARSTACQGSSEAKTDDSQASARTCGSV